MPIRLLILFLILLPVVRSVAQERPRFQVYVVGDGSPEAWAVESGAARARLWSEALAPIRDSLRIRPASDDGDPDKARDIARDLATNPAVLAVIGHATSGTTEEAAWIYEKAGIPLVMPMATSPRAIHRRGSIDSGSSLLRNVFRMTASDDRVQAPAIMALVQRREHRSCFLLKDLHLSARAYSTALADEVETLLNEAGLRYGMGAIGGDTSAGSQTYEAAAGQIYSTAPEVVIFCGYEDEATPLFAALRKHYQSTADPRPTIVLSDGCKSDSLDTSGFETYLTSPLPDLNTLNRKSQDLNQIQRQFSGKEQSAEAAYYMIGYDAMLIIGHTAAKCGPAELSRRCLLRALKQEKQFQGVGLNYSFDGGENVLSRYYIFEATFDTGTSYELKYIYDVDGNLIPIFAK